MSIFPKKEAAKRKKKGKSFEEFSNPVSAFSGGDDLESLIAGLKQDQGIFDDKPKSNINVASSSLRSTKSIPPPAPVPHEILDVSSPASSAELNQIISASSSCTDSTPTVLAEACRHTGVKAVAQKFCQLTQNTLGKKWYTHFEAWLFTCRAGEEDPVGGRGQSAWKKGGGAALRESSGRDPCIPGSWAGDDDLARKITAAGGEAGEVLNALHKTATRALQVLKRSPTSGPSKVKVKEFRAGKEGHLKMCLVGGGVKVEVNKSHFLKLRVLHHLTAQRAEEGGRHGEGAGGVGFEEAVFCMLARYSALQGTHYRGGGFQAAIHSEAFDVLGRMLGVRMEMFASPLNCRWPLFCSACPDTDQAFGSQGSFFDFHPTEGSYEANPPFDDLLILHMAKHMDGLLARTSKALSFIVIIPEADGKAGWKHLKGSGFLRHHLLLIAGQHGYKEGAQHNRANTHRTAHHNTSVFFLQTAAAMKKWPVTDKILKRLEAAFASKQPTSEEKTLSLKPVSPGNRLQGKKRPRPEEASEDEDDEREQTEMDMEGEEDQREQPFARGKKGSSFQKQRPLSMTAGDGISSKKKKKVRRVTNESR